MDVAQAFNRDAADYDRTRRQLIPCFDDFYGVATALAPAANAPLRVLDLGAGTGLFASFIAQKYADAHLTLVDAAEEMLERAKERFAGNANVEYIVADYARDLPPRRFDLVISALSIHHLSDDDKRRLFRNIYDALEDGGAFINADEVLAPSPDLEAKQHDAWRAGARALGASESDLTAAQTRMTHDRCATLQDQLRWMRDAGFREVDCYFRWWMFAVMYGRR